MLEERPYSDIQWSAFFQSSQQCYDPYFYMEQICLCHGWQWESVTQYKIRKSMEGTSHLYLVSFLMHIRIFAQRPGTVCRILQLAACIQLRVLLKITDPSLEILGNTLLFGGLFILYINWKQMWEDLFQRRT